MTKERILEALRQRPNTYLSGAELARQLRLSRTAVWKAVEQLKTEGYQIDAAPRRGYAYRAENDVLSEAGIRRFLKHQELEVRVFREITSTNTVLKTLAAEQAPAGLALVAESQKAGRGRLGRSFFSPPGTGLYLSLLLRPALQAEEATRLTACAAVAAAEAVEELSGLSVDIKWVNDLYLGGKKICGILTEAGLDCETGCMSYVVIGIGINLRIPEDNFPEPLREIAGAVFGRDPIPDLRNRLAARILDNLTELAINPASPEVFEAYKKRSFVLGHRVLILAPGKEPEEAEAIDLDRRYGLIVHRKNGEPDTLRSGEISVRLSEAEEAPDQ